MYRGNLLPDLYGHYLYGDFVSGRLWALKYDEEEERVVGNFKIPGPSLPVTSFGEDENREVYFTTVTANGEGVYKFIGK